MWDYQVYGPTCEDIMPEVRTILCETCGSEGRIYRQHVTNPYDEVDHGECPDCRGTGTVEIEVCPVTMTEPGNRLCKHGYDVDRGVLCPVCDS